MTEDVLNLTTDEALLSSLVEHKLEDIKLEPFSLLHHSIAMDLAAVAEPGSFFHVVITVWVSTLKPEDALRAYRDKIKAQIAAHAWAEAKGYSIFNFQPLIDAYNQLNRELAASTRAHVKPSTDTGNGEEIPNAGGQPA